MARMSDLAIAAESPECEECERTLTPENEFVDETARFFLRDQAPRRCNLCADRLAEAQYQASYERRFGS